MADMEKQQRCKFVSLITVVIILGLVSFALCFAAEFKRSKKRDLRFDGELCYLPKSDAFGLGMVALMFLLVAQIIGNLLICGMFVSGGGIRSSCKAKGHTTPSIFLLLSWISFGVALVLLSGGISMSRTQKFGEGWVDGECYIVKDGVFIGCAILVLITLSLILSSAIKIIKIREIEQAKKVHAHV